MAQDFLSNIELYFSSLPVKNNFISVEGDENKHLTKVMRHAIGDTIYITNGHGKIFKSKILNVDKQKSSAEIIETFSYRNQFSNFVFCLPVLKNSDRFEFALEKSIEMGITNFLVYKAERSLTRGNKLPRWNKIALAAMKQSLRSFLPTIDFVNSTKEIKSINGTIILFDQSFGLDIKEFTKNYSTNDRSEKLYFIFGPEGGLTNNEIDLFENPEKLKLSENRLRSESAVVYTASILNSLLK